MIAPHDLLSRRALCTGAAAATLVGCGGASKPRASGPPRSPSPASSTLPSATARLRDSTARLEAIEARLGGTLGVAAIDTGSGVRVGHRSGERFAMCSTFKAPLAAAVLARVDAGELALDRSVPYAASDLLDHAPVSRAHVAEGALSIEALCAASVEVSDNTAANLLLGLIGGPAGFTAFVRGLGDPTTRLDRNEPMLNTNLPGDPRDTTSPDAMVGTFGAMMLDPRVLSEPSRARWFAWLERSRTGLGRLRGGFPAGWRVGDKTGTGENGAANDVAVAWPPARAPLVVACYVNAPGATAEARNQAHVEVARVVVEAFP